MRTGIAIFSTAGECGRSPRCGAVMRSKPANAMNIRPATPTSSLTSSGLPRRRHGRDREARRDHQRQHTEDHQRRQHADTGAEAEARRAEQRRARRRGRARRSSAGPARRRRRTSTPPRPPSRTGPSRCALAVMPRGPHAELRAHVAVATTDVRVGARLVGGREGRAECGERGEEQRRAAPTSPRVAAAGANPAKTPAPSTAGRPSATVGDDLARRVGHRYTVADAATRP